MSVSKAEPSDQSLAPMASRARRLQKSVHSPEQTTFQRLMVEARDRAGLTQQQLAKRLGRHQSFVAKYAASVASMSLNS